MKHPLSESLFLFPFVWPMRKLLRLCAWSLPAFNATALCRVRFRVPVHADAAEPLALRVDDLSGELVGFEVFVNGLLVGGFGLAPPSERLLSLSQAMVFDHHGGKWG